jgi:large subunit ribosomal protein L29e
MVKQKHHTCRNKSYKEHRQGIKKVQRNRYVNTKGMDQKFLKCRRYSKHGSAEKVKADLESSGKVAVKKMHPAVRERKKHAAESKAGEAPVWVKPQIVRAASSHRLKHRVSISDQKAVAESGRAAGSVMAMVRGEQSAAQLNTIT